MKKVAVVTPVPIRRDSRALKQASSLNSLGFDTILFEGEASIPAIALEGVAVMSPATVHTPHSSATPKTSSQLSWLRRRLSSHDATFVEACAMFSLYLAYFTWHYVVRGVRTLPHASIYYLNEYSFYPAVRIRSFFNGARIAYDARDFYIGIEPDDKKSHFQRLVSRFGRLVEGWCISQARVFTTVGDGIADLFETEYNRRPTVLYNTHDERIDAVPVKSLRQHCSLSENDTVVVIVGQAKPGQEFSGILTALERLPTLNVAFIGNGYRTILASRLSPAIVGRLHFVENLPATDVVPILRGADASIVVYYSRSANYANALPNGFFQSVAAGLVVLHGGLPEMLRMGEKFAFGVIVAPDDPDEISTVLRRVIEKDDWYREQQERAREAMVKLKWKNQEKILGALFEQGE